METAKLLYRRLDALFGTLDPKRPPGKALESFLEDAFRTLHEDLRLRAGLLFAERRDGFALTKTVGDLESPVAETLDPSKPPLSLIFRHRVYIFSDLSAEGSPQRLGLLPVTPVVSGAGDEGLGVGRVGPQGRVDVRELAFHFTPRAEFPRPVHENDREVTG